MDTTNIHRYLDEAFADIPRTPETADLKEELRGNLQSRVAELESRGSSPDGAVARAIKELGPIAALVAELGAEGMGAGDPSGKPGETAARLVALNRVKQSPFYIVRTVLLALLLAAGLALAVLGAVHVLAWSLGLLVAIAVLDGAFVGVLTADALSHETTQHYPTSAARAAGFGGAAFVGLAGLEFVGTFLGNTGSLWLLVTGCALALVSLVAFIALGVTQTNRTKPWVKDLNQAYAIEDGFSQDPASAARFGLYTVVIWVLAFAGFAVLSITVGFVWSWLALLAGLVIFFLVLARMLFPTKNRANK